MCHLTTGIHFKVFRCISSSALFFNRMEQRILHQSLHSGGHQSLFSISEQFMVKPIRDGPPDQLCTPWLENSSEAVCGLLRQLLLLPWLCIKSLTPRKAGSIADKLCLTGPLHKESTKGFVHSSLEEKTHEEACSSLGTSHGASIG